MWVKQVLPLALAFSLFSEETPSSLPESLSPMAGQAPATVAIETPKSDQPSPAADQTTTVTSEVLHPAQPPSSFGSANVSASNNASPQTGSAAVPVAAQALSTATIGASNPTPVENKPIKKTAYPIPKRLMLSHNMGYGENFGPERGTDFTTFEVFLAPDYCVGSFYPLIDLRGHRFDNDSYALNIGIGGRYIPSSNNFCEMMGINFFYDWRQGFLTEYNQFGIGLEVLGKRWDFRANGYFPVGQKKYKVTCVFDQYEGGYVITERKFEITTYGYNLEVGWLAIASKNFLLYAAAGPYYLTRKSCCFESIVGGKIRMRPQYKDYIALDVSYCRDSNSNSFWETTFIVSLPLYQITNQNERPCRLTDRQIYQPIERFEIMTLGKRSCWTQNY
jgi:hypothetical protein